MRILCSILLVISAIDCAAQLDFRSLSSLNSTDSMGLREGIWLTYFSDSCIESIGVYHDGELNGIFIAMYPDGQIQTYANFDHGQRHGLSRAYNRENQATRVSEYQHGLPLRVNTYDESGTLIIEEYYQNGLLVKSIHHTAEGIIEGRPSPR